MTQDNQLSLSVKEFIDSHQNSLTWYDMLPGQGFEITGDIDERTAAAVADVMLSLPSIDSVEVIDLLAIKILNSCPSIEYYSNWFELSVKLSELMANNLNASGDRSTRMKAQRLNYYLQMVLDRDKNIDWFNGHYTEKTLWGSKPWDYYRSSEGEWWITSDDKNIHYLGPDGTKKSWSIGLPTQIDPQPDGKIAIGSLYTNGAIIGDRDHWEVINHESPVILVFEYQGRRLFLDVRAQIWEDSPRTIVEHPICEQVHFARYFDGVVYILNNGNFGYITSFDLRTGKIELHSTFPVLVCNDIVATKNGFYLIDKQQGSVFKFDENWQFKDKVFKFGEGSGCLMDPVALRLDNNNFYAISWISARLTTFSMF